MAQEMIGKIPKLEWLFHQAILNAKEARINGCSYCIHHIDGLQKISTDIPLEQKSVISFCAEAEIHFVSQTEGGVSYSTGERLKIRGVVVWKDNNWVFVDQLIVEDRVNVWNFKKCGEDEQSVI